MEKISAEIPFLGTILKNELDTERFIKMSQGHGSVGFKRRY